MTSATQPIRRARQRLTYARARLYLGMTAVGSAAIGATWLLVALTPSRWIADSPTQPLLHTLATIAIVFASVLVAGVLPDMIGGALLVRHRTMVGVWFARWLRGAVVQFAVWMFAATAFVMAARANTTQTMWVVVGVFVFLQLLLAQFRGAFARVVASLPIQTTPERIRTAAALAGFDAKSVVVVETPDEGFVGGFTTVAGGPLLLPQRWAQLPTDVLHAACVRRRLLQQSAAHWRGALGAIVWNTVGMIVVLTLTGANPASVYGLLVLMAGMTIFAFVSVLVLPSVSRAAVFAADRAAAQVVGAAAMRTTIEVLDRWQDDEPVRSTIVETIFHPVPSRSARFAKLAVVQSGEPLRWWHAHHIARHALWTNWAAMTPLSRLVHCNIGRSALWVMLPSD